jgi:hypothetical protein
MGSNCLTTGFPSLCFLSTNLNSSPSQSIPILATIAILSIKKDKLHQIIYNYQQQNDLRKQLLVIKNLADNYPNSGSLNKALNNFDKDLGIRFVFKFFQDSFYYSCPIVNIYIANNLT